MKQITKFAFVAMSLSLLIAPVHAAKEQGETNRPAKPSAKNEIEKCETSTGIEYICEDVKAPRKDTRKKN